MSLIPYLTSSLVIYPISFILYSGWSVDLDTFLLYCLNVHSIRRILPYNSLGFQEANNILVLISL